MYMIIMVFVKMMLLMRMSVLVTILIIKTIRGNESASFVRAEIYIYAQGTMMGPVTSGLIISNAEDTFILDTRTQNFLKSI